jgi:magnesium transporter
MKRRTSVDARLARVALVRYPDVAAAVAERMPDHHTAGFLQEEDAEAAIALVRRLTPDRAARITALFDPERGRRVVEALNPNRAASLLARLDPDERERVLGWLEPKLADELRELVEYPPDSAGGLMDPRVTSFRPDATVGDVLRRLRRFRDRRIGEIFLVDAEGFLSGSVALQDVALASQETHLDAIASRNPPRVEVTARREEVIEQFERQRVANLPVVDFHGHLVGVLRQRELIQAAQEEATATAVTMVGASEQERALSPPLFAVRKRLPWLQVNLLTAFLASAVVGLFEETIARVTALAVLLPVVAGQSGNTGAQALAVTMRGLALREVRTRQWWPVLAKEVIAGAANGVAVALVTSLAVWLWSRSVGLALVIGVSMVLSMTLAGLSGAAIPLLLTALRQDPAQSSSIILTTVTDVVGFASFLGIATLLATLL